MPVAFLTGIAKEKDPEVFGWIDQGNKDQIARNGLSNGEGRGADGMLSVKKLVYIGLRDVDKGEKEILRKHKIKSFSMHDVDK